MADLAKAQLIEMNDDFKNPKPGGQNVKVQFNPESLKITYANQIEQPKGGDQASGTGGRQFVGAGTTKLALQLWFDVTAVEQNEPPIDDVRRLTQKVVYFMTPQNFKGDPTHLAPPPVRFQWGSFLFDGMVDGIEQSLEFFSPDGKPLRASLSLSLSQQKILKVIFGNGPGTNPLIGAKLGDTLQSLAAKGGRTDWQSIASANSIEDPLRLAPGQLINLNAGAAAGARPGGSFGIA
jgi:hypothetical protein